MSQAPLPPPPDPPAAWWAPPLPAQSHRLLEPQSACLSSGLTVPYQPTPHLPHRVVVRLQRQTRSQKAIIRSEGLYTRQTQDSPASMLSEGEGLLSPRGRVRSWWGEGPGHWPSGRRGGLRLHCSHPHLYCRVQGALTGRGQAEAPQEQWGHSGAGERGKGALLPCPGESLGVPGAARGTPLCP